MEPSAAHLRMAFGEYERDQRRLTRAETLGSECGRRPRIITELYRCPTLRASDLNWDERFMECNGHLPPRCDYMQAFLRLHTGLPLVRSQPSSEADDGFSAILDECGSLRITNSVDDCFWVTIENAALLLEKLLEMEHGTQLPAYGHMMRPASSRKLLAMQCQIATGKQDVNVPENEGAVTGFAVYLAPESLAVICHAVPQFWCMVSVGCLLMPST